MASELGRSFYSCSFATPSKGGLITTEEGIIISPIPGFNSHIIRVKWNTPKNEDYWSCFLTVPFLERPNWDFGILARIDDGNPTPGINQTSYPTGTFALGANNVAVSTGGIIYRDWFKEIINIEPVWREAARMEIAQLKKNRAIYSERFCRTLYFFKPRIN